MLRNIFLITLSTLALTVAGGRSAPSDTGGNGGDGGSMSDTTQVQGTVSSVDLQNQMFVIESDTGMDTVYFNDQTEFNPADSMEQILQMDNDVMVWYTQQEGDKVAVRIEMATSDGSMNGSGQDTMNGGSGSKDTMNGGGKDTMKDTMDGGSNGGDTMNGGQDTMSDTGSGW